MHAEAVKHSTGIKQSSCRAATQLMRRTVDQEQTSRSLRGAAAARTPCRATHERRWAADPLFFTRPRRCTPPLQAFLEYYYGLFGSNRAALASLYQEQSMFTFEGSKCQGAAAITAKLTSLPFNQCKITPASMDFQPSISGGIIVFVTGHVQVRLALPLSGGRVVWLESASCSAAFTPPQPCRSRCSPSPPLPIVTPPPPKTEGEANALKFSQVFHLMPVGTSFVVTNGGWWAVVGQ